MSQRLGLYGGPTTRVVAQLAPAEPVIVTVVSTGCHSALHAALDELDCL